MKKLRVTKPKMINEYYIAQVRKEYKSGPRWVDVSLNTDWLFHDGYITGGNKDEVLLSLIQYLKPEWKNKFKGNLKFRIIKRRRFQYRENEIDDIEFPLNNLKTAGKLEDFKKGRK